MNRNATGMVGAAVLISVLAAPPSRPTKPAVPGGTGQAQGGTPVDKSKRQQGSDQPLDLSPRARSDYSGMLARVFLDVCRVDSAHVEPSKSAEQEAAARKPAGNDPTNQPDGWWVQEAFPGDEEAAEKLRGLHQEISGACADQSDRYLIAVVPDPVHTRLALSFDRAVEVIQEAALDGGYAFVRALMPWDSKAHPESDDPEARLEDQSYVRGREELPGLLAFRRLGSGSSTVKPRPEHLFVLVVGESPTRGVVKKQFLNALAWIRATSKEQPELRILGPTFSGSLASLAQLLRCGSEPDAGTPAGSSRCDRPATVRIYSGTVSSRSSVLQFFEQESGQKVTFASFQEADDVVIERFVEFLAGSGYRRDEIAILSEDETEYGAGRSNSSVPGVIAGRDSCESCLRLFFPREISRLRAAYQSSDVKAPGADAASAPRDVLPLNLEISGADDDTIASYSKQAPLSQEGVLLSIVSDLRRRAVQVILLRATDPLDLLFLSRYLAAAYPKARIVTLGADLLFRREAEDRNLHGVLALSTYAPIPWADREFMHSREYPGRNFPSSLEAGEYNALLALLDPHPVRPPRDPKHDRLELDSKDLHLYQYGWLERWRQDTYDQDPATANTPPVHVLALGRDEYWPVAHLGTTQGLSHEVGPKATEGFPTLLPQVPAPQFRVERHAHEVCDARLPCAGAAPDPLAISKQEPLHYPVNTSWVLAVLTACLLAFGFASMLWLSSIFKSSQSLAQLAPADMGARELLVVAAALMLTSTLSILLLPFAAGGSLWDIKRGAVLQSLLWAAMSAVFLAAMLDLVSRGWLAAHPAREAKTKRSTSRWYAYRSALIMLLPAAAAAFLAWTEVSRRSAEDGLTGSWRYLIVRSMQLSSGLSPILPILLLLTAGLWWAFQASSSGALLDARRPLLPRGFLNPRVRNVGEHVTGEQSKGSGEARAGEQSGSRTGGQGQAAAGSYVTAELLEALPLSPSKALVYLVLLAAAGVLPCVLGRWQALKTIENGEVTLVLHLSALALLALILHTTWRLWSIWQKTRRLLGMLDSLPLRRGFKRLEGFSWPPLWRVALVGLEAFQRNLASVMEALTVAMATTAADDVFPDGSDGLVQQVQPLRCLVREAMSVGERKRMPAARGHRRLPPVIRRSFAVASSILRRRGLELEVIKQFGNFQGYIAVQAGQALNYLAASWDEEKEGPKKRRKDETQRDWNLRACERFVCLVYVSFLLVVMLRLRNLIMAIGGMYILIMVAMTVYPFQPAAVIQGSLALLLLVVIAVVTTVLAQVHRDATLSHITNTNPGELGSDFWIRTGSFVALPLFTFFVSQFPQVNRFFYSWLEPALKALNK